MSEPTRLTSEDLPTLRRLAAFLDARSSGQTPQCGLQGVVGRFLCRTFAGVLRTFILAIERTGHLASDERVDKDGRVSRL